MNACLAWRWLGAAAVLLTAGAVHAQGWPGKPLRILVGSPPGGPSDITARLIGEQLSKRVNQPVVVENRPGAGNNLAAGAAAKAEPDGTTLVLSPDTVLTVNPLVYKNSDFDAKRDLVNVSIVASFQAAGSPRESTVRTIFEVAVQGRAGEWDRDVTIEVEGDGFLYKMVRAIVGTLVEVGRGKRSELSLAEVLSARNRPAAGQTAPPHGLFLVAVRYGMRTLGP